MKIDVKEAKSIRGLSDTYGTFRGKPIYVEFKRSKKHAQEQTGRIVLQRLFLQRHAELGAICAFIYPENFEEFMTYLNSFPLITNSDFKIFE